MNEPLIKVEGVSKKFCRSLKKSLWYGLQDLAREITGRRCGGDGRLRPDEFWAVKDVSFELNRGERLGLIGRNGAGKTTLLRMLNGLIKPDAGRIEMRGRVGGLIALGAGFNPILTGRENIYVNASVLGLSKREIDEKLDEIIDFAEIGEFIDSPVQNYSSGMQVRLGFAVATTLDPDILMLDEVLAVGDAAFRYKCHHRINKALKQSAVIFVSHDMPSLARICNKTLVLKNGEMRFWGATSSGIEIYRSINEDGVSSEKGFLTLTPPIVNFVVQLNSKEIASGATLIVDMMLASSRLVGNVVLRLAVFTFAGAFAADCLVESDEYMVIVKEGANRWTIEIASLPLKAGRYKVSFSVSDSVGEFLAVSYKQHEIIVNGGHSGTVADCQLAIRSWSTA